MARFDRQIQTALRLIKKNGRKVQWRQIVATENPSEPWNPSPGTPVDNDVDICFLPVDKTTYETLTLRAGTELPKVSELGYMGAVNFEPNLKDVVIRDGKEMAIVYIDKLAPNGQNIFYTVLFAQ